MQTDKFINRFVEKSPQFRQIQQIYACACVCVFHIFQVNLSPRCTLVLLHINSHCSLNSSAAADRNEKSLLSAETKFNGVDAGRINWTRFYQAAACIEHQNNIVKSVEKDTDIICGRA